MANKNLSAAKKAKNDEFYTQYADIEKEMNAYIEYNPDVFRCKTVLLPCDDPEWSNFTKYFAQNFERFGLKKLISTSYAANSKQYQSGYQPTLFETNNPQYDANKTISKGKIFTLTTDKTEDGKIDIADLEWQYLEGDGDFRSDEIKRLRDEADIIVTNPPFSLFREFLAWIVESDKLFVLIGSKNAITYKEVFPLIKNNKMWVGTTSFNKDMLFISPDKIDPSTKNSTAIRTVDGIVYLRSPSVWFTNIDHGRRHQPLQLMSMEDNRRFNKKVKESATAYQTYDNYDAIEVPFTNAIPSDYDGLMGVPISFLDKYCPEQFEIFGATQRGCHDEVPDTKKYDDYWEVKQNGDKTGSSGGKTNENANLAGNDGKKNYFINHYGHVIQSAYQRIFIKHRTQS
ncbi:MAG: adenine-specific methyltransferase EcoRI family protein [Gammaproteobacteria bacterium]|nr:adenine-specific methyltransferase EcoRI family protein [Gammaproteobacteria bacterium]